MSQEATPPVPAPESPAQTSPQKRPKKGRWKRRLLKTLFALVLFAVVFRIGLFFLLAATLNKVANFYDLDLKYDRQEITLLGGDAGLWGVKVSNRGDPTPFLVADYVHGNVSVLALLRTNIEIWRMEADGVTLDVTRTADGRIPLMDLVMKQMNATAPAPAPSSNEPLELGSPFKIDAMRLYRLRVRMNDLAVSPAFHETFNVDLRVSDLRNPERPTSIEADVWSGSVLSAMRFNGTGTASGRVVNLDAVFSGAGLNLQPLSQYLEPLGLKPVARAVDWSGKLKLSTDAADAPTALTAKVEVSDFEAFADSSAVASVKQVLLVAKTIGESGAAFENLAISGVRVHADRSSDGRLRFAGIELASPSTPPAVVPAVSVRPEPAASTRPTSEPASRPASQPGPAFVTLDSFTLHDLVATFNDDAMSPPTRLSVSLDELSSTGIVRDPSGRLTLPVKGIVRAPGLAESIAISGQVQPFEPPFAATIRFDASHVQPDSAAPYLSAWGIESTLKAAKLSGSVGASLQPTSSGGMMASLKLESLELQDADDRLALPLLEVRDLSLEPVANQYEIGSVRVVGPEFRLVRRADGALETMGLRYLGMRSSSAAPATQPAGAPSTAPSTAPFVHPSLDALPVVLLKQLDWEGVKLELADEARGTRFNVTDVGAKVSSVRFDMSEQRGQPGMNGDIRAWASVPGIVGRFEVSGTTSSRAGDFGTHLNVSGKQINLADVAPYLEPLGIVPTLADGTFEASFGLQMRRFERDLAAVTLYGAAQLADGETLLFDAPQWKIDDIRLRDWGVEVRSMEFYSGTLVVRRDAQGNFHAAGFKLVPPTADVPVAADPNAPLIPIPQLPIPIEIDMGNLSSSSIVWVDERVSPPVTREIGMTGSIGRLRIDQRINGTVNEPPGGLGVTLYADGLAEELNIHSSLRVTHDRVEAEASVKGTGLTGTALQPYLPSGFVPTLQAGTLTAGANVKVRNVAGGAQQVELSVKDVLLQDAGKTLAKVDRVDLGQVKLDLARNEVQVDRVVVAGAAMDATIGRDGSLRLPALTIEPVIDEPSTQEASQTVVATAEGAPADADAVAAQLAAARKPLPMVSVERIDVGVERVGVRMEARGDAPPVAIEGLKLTNLSPIRIGGMGARDLPPVELRIETEVSPLVRHVEIDLTAAPFAEEATFSGTLNAKAISGQGLIDLVPELAGIVDGSSMTDGSLSGKLDARLRVKRSRPTDFDLRRGFEGEVNLSDITYRDAAGAEPVAGVEGISLEGIRVNEAFAGGSVKLMTISNPMARVVRDAEGIHLLGWTIRMPTGDATTQPATQPALVEAPAQTPEKDKPLTETAPGPEFRIEKLLVSGSDVVLRDISVEPALVVPINALDVEVKGLSNRMLVEPDRSVRFSVLVGSDKVELPTRAGRGQPTTSPTEMRPLLSQVTSTGQVSFFPALDGYAKAAVSGFEMQSLIGEAEALGITLGDGIFDGTFDARFRDGGNLDLKTRLVVTDLKMSEQPNGLVQRTLGLQAPVDAIIGLVEDPSGAITFPLAAQIKGGELNMGSVVGSIVSGVAQVCATAIASQPAKMLQGMFGGDQQPEEPRPPVVLAFLPADTSLESDLRARLDELVNEMRRDPNLVVTLSHRLSTEDGNRATVLASPTTEQIEQMTTTLRARRLMLINERSVQGAGVAAELGSGGTSEVSLAGLRTLDQEIVANDEALERVLDLTRPGADLQSGRRMKATALDIASARLQTVKRYLEEEGVRRRVDLRERVSIVNPRFEIDPALSGGGTVTIEQTVRKRAQ